MGEIEQTLPENVTGATNRKEEIKAGNDRLTDVENDDIRKPSLDTNNRLVGNPHIKNSEETSPKPDGGIEIIETKGHTIQVNLGKLNEIKERYGISDWGVQFDTKFSFSPSVAIWKTRTVVIRPFNFWSYLAVGFSVEKRNKVLPRLLAHELRHSQQERPSDSLRDILLSVRYAYWSHPMEIDAREWSTQHHEEFQGLVRIDKK